ncbi:MAG: MFS transporter, partial [Actinomycetota bacterium]
AAEWSIGFWGPEFLTAALGFSPSAAATSMGLFFGAMLTGRVLASRLARRVDDRTLLVATLCLASLGFLLLWLSGAPVPGLAGLLLTGLGLAGVYPVGLSVGVGTVPLATDTAAARLGIAAATAIFVLPLIVGRLADAIGIIDAFGLVAPLLVAAVVLTALDRRSFRRTGGHRPASEGAG